MTRRPGVRLLIGREPEQARLAEILDAIGAHGHSLLVVGEAGVGKTALVTDAATRAREAGMRVLRTAGVPSEAHLPFAALGQLLGSVIGLADELPDFQREALLTALGQREGHVNDPFVVGLAALTLLRDLAADAPLVLVLEDVQWLDRLTYGVLAQVARRIEHDPIVLLATSRDGPKGAVDEARFEQIDLTGLDDESATELVGHHAPDLDDVLRARLLAEAHGNPLALVELAIAWRSLPPGTLIASFVPLTTRLENTYAARVRSLDERTQLLLSIAAHEESGRIAEVVAAASALSGGPVSGDHLQGAVEARIVEAGEATLTFRHPLARSAIHQMTPLDVRRNVHRVLAEVLADDPDRSAWHRAASVIETDEEIAASLEAAAERAMRRGAALSAVAALERSAELTPDLAARGQRLVRAADRAADLGRPDVVTRLLDEADGLPLEPVPRARAAWRRQLIGGALGRDRAQLQSILSVIDSMCEAADVENALSSLVSVAVAGWWVDADDERRQMIVDAAQRLPVPTNDPRLVTIMAMASPAEHGATVRERIAVIPTETLEPIDLLYIGSAAAATGSFALAANLQDLAIDGLRRQGRISNLSGALASRTSLAWHLGQWNLALRTGHEARRLGEQTERPANAGTGVIFAAAVVAARGDPETATASLDEVDATFRPLGARPILALANYIRGVAAIARGQPDIAYELLRQALTPPGAATMVGQGAETMLADVAAAIGAQDDVAVQFEAAARIAHMTGSPYLACSISYSRAILASDKDAGPLFDAAFASDIATYPFMQARLLLAYGSWLRRQRHITNSRAPLRSARTLFDGLGAAWWSERARQELRATGEVSAEHVPDALERLTPQELEIATLVAAGLTNREIGQQLYLSHRTVGSHLYHMFPKLGITSRNQLAAMLQGRTEP